MVAVPDNHDPVMMVMTPAVIVMHFGTRVEMVTIMSDHDVFSACDRRRRDGDRAKRGNNVSKLLHDVLLV